MTVGAEFKKLLELDPGLYALQREHKVGVAIHYFCEDCDYHDRRYYEIAWSIADNFKRPIAVPHHLHEE